MIHPLAVIHDRALVDDDCVIGAGTRIWQFASVIRGTRLGIDCNVASCVTLDGPYIGDRVILSPGVDIGPGFMIHDDCFIGPNVVLCNDRWPSVSKVAWSAEALRAGAFTVVLSANVSIGANAVVLPGVSIGSGAMIAAGAVVDRNVPANHLFTRKSVITPIDRKRINDRMRIVLE